MNREIKFRGLEEVTKQWFYGYYLCDGTDHYVLEGDTFGSVRVVLESVGQYTGLKDKHGTEIYEGDIFIRVKNKPVEWIVEWADCSFVAYHNGGRFDSFPVCMWLINEYKELEIIGNIYQSPELIK